MTLPDALRISEHPLQHPDSARRAAARILRSMGFRKAWHALIACYGVPMTAPPEPSTPPLFPHFDRVLKLFGRRSFDIEQSNPELFADESSGTEAT